jgi:hypothetical protein
MMQLIIKLKNSGKAEARKREERARGRGGGEDKKNGARSAFLQGYLPPPFHTSERPAPLCETKDNSLALIWTKRTHVRSLVAATERYHVANSLCYAQPHGGAPLPL